MDTKFYFTQSENSLNGYIHIPEQAKPKTERTWKKVPKNFESRDGICYIDDVGKEYTYDDIFAVTMNAKGTQELFEALKGKTPEETADDKWYLRKCPRCGGYIYTDGKKLHGHDGMCVRCTPLRTNGHISVPRDPYEDDRKFYKGKEAVFEPGLTTLIGCNGIGKTTLLLHIREELKQRGTPHLYFDNLGSEGGENIGRSIFNCALGGYGGGKISLSEAASLYVSSEGEKIAAALNAFAERIADSLKRSGGYGEFWVLFDAIDSGLSLDVIEEVKEYLFGRLCGLSDEDNRIYIISSSNSFELSEGTKCFSVEKMKYVDAKAYPLYRKEVLSSRRFKEERDKILCAFSRAMNMAFVYNYDENLVKETQYYHKGTVDGDVAVLTVSDYRMTVHAKSGRSDVKVTCSAQRMSDGKKLSCKKYEEEISDCYDRKERLRTAMHESLCRIMAKETYRAGKA